MNIASLANVEFNIELTVLITRSMGFKAIKMNVSIELYQSTRK